MSNFFAAENIVSNALAPCVPWEFKITENITEQIRQSKEDRQAWYQSPTTKHCFYTGIEPLNPNLRVNKENNSPLKLWAFVADYDLPVTDERINEAIESMRVKPAWVERSLSGNFRLVWMLPRPLWVDSNDFCTFLLQESKKFLGLGMLPGLDEPAYVTTTRLYCNGGVWRDTGHGAIREQDAQMFFIEAGRKFRFNAPESETVPLEIVEAGLKEKFPAFSWPSAFELNSQGPSFWIPESVSPQSAIVKPGGMFTFSAHAERPFYTWAQILGEEFVRNFESAAMTKATADTYFDGRSFWRKKHGVFVAVAKEEEEEYLEVDCKLASKGPKGGGPSPIKKALAHIRGHNDVISAAPFVFRPPGILIFQGQRRLNTYAGKPMEPATGSQKFGPRGESPMISAFWAHMLKADPNQLLAFQVWWKYFYECAFNWDPQPGQWFILTGVNKSGKTFGNRHMIGASVGGFVDATKVLVSGSQFNASLCEWPHWTIDDAPMQENISRDSVMERFKATVANQELQIEEKFQKRTTVELMNRIGMTTNTDYTSLRLLGDLDNAALDKLCLFRGTENPEDIFPFPMDRREVWKTLQKELPFFLRALLDMKVPDDFKRDSRFGFAAYHNEFLLDRIHQGSPSAPFKEILLKSLKAWFEQNPEATEFAGTCSDVYGMMMSDGFNSLVLRSYSIDKVNRYLENLQKLRLINCTTRTGDGKSRVWVFPAPPKTPPPPQIPVTDPTTPNPFDK